MDYPRMKVVGTNIDTLGPPYHGLGYYEHLAYNEQYFFLAGKTLLININVILITTSTTCNEYIFIN